MFILIYKYYIIIYNIIYAYYLRIFPLDIYYILGMLRSM